MSQSAHSGADLPDHVEETIQKIARLHIDHRLGASGLQRTVERLTRFFSRPRAAGALGLTVAVWVVLNLGLAMAGGRPLDPPPFGLLQSLSGVAALFMTVFILITQRREDELSELREQLTLELAMLSEQKAAKIIQLLEELRRDLPLVKDRHDPEANVLAKSADPDAVLEALKETQGAGGAVPPAEARGAEGPPEGDA